MDDAWVALALHLVVSVDLDDDESLSSLIGCADVINHAILGYDEVTRSLDKLSARGWLAVEGRVCALTPEAASHVASAMDQAGSPMAWTELKPALAAAPPFVAPHAPHPTPEAFAAGVRRYCERTNGILARMKKERKEEGQ